MHTHKHTKTSGVASFLGRRVAYINTKYFGDEDQKRYTLLKFLHFNTLSILFYYQPKQKCTSHVN